MAIEKHLYYWSNDSIPFDTVEMTTKLEGNQYPLVVDAPEGLKSPKFDWSTNQWVENDASSQGQQIAELVKSVKDMQKVNADVTQENTQLKSAIQGMQQNQLQTTTVLSQLMPAVQELSKFAAALQQKEGDK